jgi:hypothetical protein
MPPRVDAAGAGWGGAIGAGTGFGARFLVFALLAGFAFFIPFFLRAGAPRFAFLDFFATFNLPNRINQNYATALAEATTSNWRTPCVNHSSM